MVIPLLKTPLREHQLKGLEVIERFDGRALVADEMGVGKTLTALAYIFKHNLFPAVIVTPASLKLNWVGEIRHHFPDKPIETIRVLSGTKPSGLDIGEQNPTTGRIYIINYDIIQHWESVFTVMRPKIFVCDESAALKNPTTKRTKTLLKLAHYCDKFLAMTGTPMLNTPLEIYPMIHMIFRGDCMTMPQFRQRYCVMREVSFGNRRKALLFVRPKNQGELHNLLMSKCMLRRKQSDVLDLPPYTRATLLYEMTPVQKKEYAQMEQDFLTWLTGAYPDRKVPRSEFAAILTRAGYMKRECAKWKIPSVLEWVDTFLENNPESKLLMFGIHKNIIHSVVEHYNKKKIPIVSITGDTKMEDRALAVEEIERGNTRLFIGNIQAAGTGLTLNRAAYSLFIELDFVTSNHLQAERRNYRLGQSNSVFWYYYIIKDTIEVHVAEILQKKDTAFREIVDGKTSEDASSFNLLRKMLRSYAQKAPINFDDDEF